MKRKLLILRYMYIILWQIKNKFNKNVSNFKKLSTDLWLCGQFLFWGHVLGVGQFFYY